MSQGENDRTRGDSLGEVSSAGHGHTSATAGGGCPSDNVTVWAAVVMVGWGDSSGAAAAVVVMSTSFDAHEHTTAVNALLD